MRRIEVKEPSLIVHPAFDCDTRTWFTDEYESVGKSISELLAGLRAETKRRVVAKDHYVGCRCPEVKYPMKTIEEFLARPESVLSYKLPKFANPSTAPTIPSSDVPKIGVPRPRTRQTGIRGASALARANLSRTDGARPRGASDFPDTIERKKIENQILDMWCAGKSGPEIAIELHLKVQYVGSNVIANARKRGDKRALVRNPLVCGVRKR